MSAKIILHRTQTEVDLLNPDPEQIHIADIAHGLSNIARFNGATRVPVSVAAHSIVVSSLLGDLSRELQLAGLLHDAAEAYLGDVVGPLKRTDLFAGYRELEARWNEAIETRFGLPPGHLDHLSVKVRDKDALEAEMLIFRDAARNYHIPAACDMAFRLVPRCGPPAESMFLDRFRLLTWKP